MPRNRRHRLAPESGVSAARPGRAEQARALSIFFFGGSAIGLVAVAFLPLTPHTDVRTATVAVAIAAALGTLLYVRAERMPGWALQVALAAGTAIVSWGSVYVAGHGQNSNELFYVWVVLYAFYFLRPRAAALQLAFVGVAYAVALGLRHEQFAVTNWVLTMSTLTVAGVVVARLVARIDRWAAHSDEREQALRHAEELFRRAFDDAAIGMALVDLDGRWIRVNGALSRLTGYAERDLIGKGFRDLTPPEDLARDVRVLEECPGGSRRTTSKSVIGTRTGRSCGWRSAPPWCAAPTAARCI